MNIADIKKKLSEGLYEGNVYTNIAYDVEYLLSIIEQDERDLTEFVDNHFEGGSKADRKDYSVMVPCSDIYKIRVCLKSIQGEG